MVSRGSELKKAESVVARLYTVLRTTLVDRYRRETAGRTREAGYALVQTLGQERWDTDPEDWICACLHKVLPMLKPEYSEALRRVDLRGAPPGKVAGDLGIAANNMKVRLHRARRALRRALFQSCRNCTEHDCFVYERARHQAAASSIDQQRLIAV